MFLLRKPLSACALSIVLSTLNILLPVPAIGQEPPLFQPLVALNRRQRDLNDPDLYVADYYPQGPAPLELPRYHYQYQFDDRNFRPAEDDYIRGENSGFQTYPVEYPGPRVLEKSLSDFLEENIPSKEDSNEEINKRVLSSFRERMEREKSKEQQEMFLQKLQEEADNRNIDRDYDNRDYIEMIEELWTKYRNTHPSKESPIFVEDMRKRQIPIDYNTLGWSGVGYKKRSPPSDNDVFFLKYPQKDVFEDDARIHYNMLKPLQSDYSYRSYNPEYLYAKRKRFPVTKRSSNFYGKSVHHKRGVNANKKMKKDSASGTDPKVVKDLSNIFGTKDLKKQNATAGVKPKKVFEKNAKYNKKNTSTAVTISPEIKTTTVKIETTPHDHNHKSEHVHSGMQHNKQQESVNHAPKDEPLNIKKKSIDWSNYFGIDRRRKKSESFTNDNDIDNDWLVKRYNNAVAMAVKRSSEYPLNFFRNHDAKRDSHKPESKEKETSEETTTKSSDDTKLGDMDNKLKNIEDLIIDEALKYTGAHEGETDPKEIQEIKDKVISRLAAAYSLEKMRRALSEFKTSLAAQKYTGKSGEIENTEEAEAAMKRKSTEPEKCKGNCEEENFSSRSGNEIDADKFSDSLVSGSGNCNAIETRCRRLVKNGFGASFYPICKWHQLCYLCGTDTGSPEELTACDVMFLNRADAICQADVVCQWAARPAVNFLRNIHETAPRELATRCESNTCDVTERIFNIKRR